MISYIARKILGARAAGATTANKRANVFDCKHDGLFTGFLADIHPAIFGDRAALMAALVITAAIGPDRA